MVNIREYKNHDEKKIVSLFNKVFEEDRKIDSWRWQFCQNPVKTPVIVVGEDKEKIVGQCTLAPTKMRLNNEDLYVGQSIDTMVHQDYRGQGLHKKLAEKTYEIGKKEDIRVRIGFPSEDALRGLLGSIGGSLVTDIPIYMKVLKLDNFLRSLVKIGPLAKILSVLALPLIKILYGEKRVKINKSYDIKEVKEFNSDFDELWDEIKDESPLMSARDSAFLNWRIKDHPEINYITLAAYANGEMKGYTILKIEEKLLRGRVESKLGSIVDLVASDSEVLTYLVKEAQRYFVKEGVDFIVTWITDSMQNKEVLFSAGFQKSKSKIPFVVKSLDTDEKLEETINNEMNWYLMPIESDFY